MSGRAPHDQRGPSAGLVADDVVDLTAFDARSQTWLLASTGGTTVETGRGRRRAQLPVPKGRKHAYRRGASATACGEPLDDLHLWPDLHFGDGLLDRCGACVERIRTSARPAHP